MSDAKAMSGATKMGGFDQSLEFPECCFCEHDYLSYCCLECPARDEAMPQKPKVCRCKKKETRGDAKKQLKKGTSKRCPAGRESCVGTFDANTCLRDPCPYDLQVVDSLHKREEKAKLKREHEKLHKVADDFLRAIHEEVDSAVLLDDADRLGHLVSQVDIVLGFELVKRIRDKGFSKEFTELCDKVGRGKK